MAYQKTMFIQQLQAIQSLKKNERFNSLVKLCDKHLPDNIEIDPKFSVFIYALFANYPEIKTDPTAKTLIHSLATDGKAIKPSQKIR